MTDLLKMRIVNLRRAHRSYAQIAKETELSINTVKSFLRRNTALEHDDHVCPQCGGELVQTAGRKPKRFCSDVCRMTWWHANRLLSKATYSGTCLVCGQSFLRANRQTFCSHGCYTKYRFGRIAIEGSEI